MIGGSVQTTERDNPEIYHERVESRSHPMRLPPLHHQSYGFLLTISGLPFCPNQQFLVYAKDGGLLNLSCKPGTEPAIRTEVRHPVVANPWAACLNETTIQRL